MPFMVNLFAFLYPKKLPASGKSAVGMILQHRLQFHITCLEVAVVAEARKAVGFNYTWLTMVDFPGVHVE